MTVASCRVLVADPRIEGQPMVSQPGDSRFVEVGKICDLKRPCLGQDGALGRQVPAEPLEFGNTLEPDVAEDHHVLCSSEQRQGTGRFWWEQIAELYYPMIGIFYQ